MLFIHFVFHRVENLAALSTFQTMFSKNAFTSEGIEVVIVWYRVSTLSHTIPTFKEPEENPFRGKGENGNNYFFPIKFSTLSSRKPFKKHLICKCIQSIQKLCHIVKNYRIKELTWVQFEQSFAVTNEDFEISVCHC